MTSPKPAEEAEPPGQKKRRTVLGCSLTFLILAGIVVLGLVVGIIKMATYNPNYVVKVYDANRVVLKSGRGVLLIGVDPPPVQDKMVGAPASAFVEKCVLDRYVQIECDVQKKDPAGWTLGYIFVNRDGGKVFVNEELLRRGLARKLIVHPNLKYRKEFEAAEAEARRKKLGLWHPDYKLTGK